MRCNRLMMSHARRLDGYNLANGRPLMAWGVEGLDRSFVAEPLDDRQSADHRSRGLA